MRKPDAFAALGHLSCAAQQRYHRSAQKRRDSNFIMALRCVLHQV
jgi:hypothetical protein